MVFHGDHSLTIKNVNKQGNLLKIAWAACSQRAPLDSNRLPLPVHSVTDYRYAMGFVKLQHMAYLSHVIETALGQQTVHVALEQPSRFAYWRGRSVQVSTT